MIQYRCDLCRNLIPLDEQVAKVSMAQWDAPKEEKHLCEACYHEVGREIGKRAILRPVKAADICAECRGGHERLVKASNKREAIDLCNEGSGANGKAVIAAAKKHLVKVLPLLDATKADGTTKKECLDSFLFRCWQLGLLRDFDKTQPKYDEMRKALCVVKDAFETDVIWAPGASPTYKQVETAREVYKAVCDALGKAKVEGKA